jgi:hypothetical protein
MMSPLALKLIGGLAALLLVVGLIWDRNRWKNTAADRKETLELICQATRDATGQPKLKCSEVPKQIQFMGQTIGTLTTAIRKQNAAVDAMGDASAKAQREAEKAVSASRERVKAAEATADRLRRSAGVPRAGNAVCEPSKELKESWR